MTNEPGKTQRELPARPAADPKPEVRPEVIQDLDVTADDIPDIVGGGCVLSKTRAGAAPSPLPLPYPN